jgi:hypothetical protein
MSAASDAWRCGRGAAGRRELVSPQQLALYLERQVEPRRADDATRITLVALSGLVP